MPDQGPDLYLSQALAHRENLLKNIAPDALHDFRTLLRRLEAALRLEKNLVDSTLAKRALDGLKALRQASNPIRDLDVLSKFFTGGNLPGPLILKRQKLAGKLWEIMSFSATLRLLLSTRDLLRQAEEKVQSKPGKKEIRSAFKKEIHRIEDELDDYRKQGLRPERLHHLRIRSKRLRYALEMFKPLRHKGWRKLRDYARDSQDTLGRLRDIQLARKSVPKLSLELKDREEDLLRKAKKVLRKLEHQIKRSLL